MVNSIGADSGGRAGYGPLGISKAMAWYSVSMVSLVSVFAQIDRGVITLLVTPIKQDLGLSDTEVSLLIGLAFSFFYVVASVPLSQLADNWSRKRVLGWALAVWSLATAACGLAQNFIQFFILRGIVGGGEGVKSPCTTSMIADYVPRERLTRAYAVFNLATNSGAALALLIGGALLAALSGFPDMHLPGLGVMHRWQLVFVIVGLPGILFAVLLMTTVPESRNKPEQDEVREKASLMDVLRHILTHRTVLVPMLLIQSLNSLGASGHIVWRPVFFERTYGWSPAYSGALIGSGYLIATVAALFVGTLVAEFLSKRNDDANMRVVLIAQLTSFPIMLASTLISNGYAALIMITVGQSLTIAAAPAQIAALQIVTPAAMRSQMSALYFITMNVIGLAGGPLVVGFLTDYVFGSEAMLRYSMAAILVMTVPAGLVITLLVLKPYARLFREAELA